MISETLQQRVRPLIAVAATLFVVDLFLGWQRVAVSMPVIDVRATASGWSGWGALAGLCALTLLTLAIIGRASAATVALGLGTLVFTALELLTGHANHLRVVFHPLGLGRVIVNREEVYRHLWRRAERQPG